MDEQRFDRLARAVAGSGSRRGVVRGLAGAVALLAIGRRVPGAAAQPGSLGPGDACRHDRQCANLETSPLFCDDNGFDYDGPLNCCTYEAGVCYSDEGCCGPASCIDGSCTSQWTAVAPGDPCQDTSQCDPAATGLTCDYVGQTGDLRCCGYEGARCAGDDTCCGWLTCPPGDFSGAFCTSASPAPDPVNCSSWGCDCDFHIPDYCDSGLVCCAIGPGFTCVDPQTCASS
jgi:hypothetical protein